MGALKDWANENWVDIGAPKKDGKYQPCGRKNAKTSKRKYPKCVPAAKAAKMSKSQKASAVRRKRAQAQGVGGKPTMVKTKGGGMAKKKFPDLSGDGKVTQKDILIGRGVVKKAVAGKLIKKAAQTISKKIKKRKSSSLPKSKEFKKFELGMDKYLGQTVAKKRYGVLPKFTSDAAKVTAGILLGATAAERKYKKAKPKRKEDKVSKADIIGKASPKGRVKGGAVDRITKQDILNAQELSKAKRKPKVLKPQKPKDPKKPDGRAQGGSVKGKDKYGEYTSKLVKKGKDFNLEERTYTKGKRSAKMRTYTPSRLFDSTGELRQALGMEDKASQADIIGKGKGRAQGGPAPSSKKNKDKTTTEDILHGKERELKKKPKKKKDLINEIQPDRIFTPGVKGPLRKVSKGGMMIKGQGAAIRGTKFKGTF